MPALPPALPKGERGDGPSEAHRQAPGSRGTVGSGEGRASRGFVPSVWGLLHQDGRRADSRNRMEAAGDAFPAVSPRVANPARRRVGRLWWMLRSEHRRARRGSGGGKARWISLHLLRHEREKIRLSITLFSPSSSSDSTWWGFSSFFFFSFHGKFLLLMQEEKKTPRIPGASSEWLQPHRG